jgi:hypothetical protein
VAGAAIRPGELATEVGEYRVGGTGLAVPGDDLGGVSFRVIARLVANPRVVGAVRSQVLLVDDCEF